MVGLFALLGNDGAAPSLTRCVHSDVWIGLAANSAAWYFGEKYTEVSSKLRGTKGLSKSAPESGTIARKH